jgi:hypothetical protein
LVLCFVANVISTEARRIVRADAEPLFSFWQLLATRHFDALSLFLVLFRKLFSQEINQLPMIPQTHVFPDAPRNRRSTIVPVAVNAMTRLPPRLLLQIRSASIRRTSRDTRIIP